MILTQTKRLTLSWSAARASRHHLVLGAILLAATILRLQYINAPLLDAHRWRQVDTATIARIFFEESINPLEPQVNWGGEHGYVESEFPLLPALVAVLYKIFGPDEMWGRLVVALFSVGAVALTYVLGSELLGVAGGRAAATLMAFSPAAVFYGRAFMPDTLMVFFSLAAVIGFVRYFASGSVRMLLLGSGAFGLAALVKLPGFIVLGGIVGAAWASGRWSALRDRRLVLALLVPAAVAVAWYWHAYATFLRTGLTFGVVGMTRTYPIDVAPANWPTSFSKWSSIELLTTWEFYRTVLWRLYSFHLMPTGFALTAVGFLLWRRVARRRVVDGWMAAMVTFILAAGTGHLGHDYYQLPIVPICALYFAAAASPAFDSEWIRARVGAGWTPQLMMVAAVTAIGMAGFVQSGVVERHFRPNALDLRMLRAGTAIDTAADDGALIIVVDDYGVNSPMLLYFARARGWSFDADTLTDSVVQGLERRGARYFATTKWSEIRQRQPDLVRYLDTRKVVPLTGAPGDTAMFDLRKSR